MKAPEGNKQTLLELFEDENGKVTAKTTLHQDKIILDPLPEGFWVNVGVSDPECTYYVVIFHRSRVRIERCEAAVQDFLRSMRRHHFVSVTAFALNFGMLNIQDVSKKTKEDD